MLDTFTASTLLKLCRENCGLFFRTWRSSSSGNKNSNNNNNNNNNDDDDDDDDDDDTMFCVFVCRIHAAAAAIAAVLRLSWKTEGGGTYKENAPQHHFKRTMALADISELYERE